MGQKKKEKVLRIVGLVALTIIIIVGVVLTIYFVQKNSDEQVINYTSGEINQLIEKGSFNFKVINFETISQNVDAGESEVKVTVEIRANEDISLSINDFNLNQYAYASQENFKNSLNKDETLSFSVNYVVKTNKELLFFIYKDIKISLGQVPTI